jgi:hypothetical protein
VQVGPIDALRGAGAGALAVTFGAAAALRGGKPIHARGVVAQARLTRTGLAERVGVAWLDEPGADVGLARLSRATGLPAPAPDVLGLAVRFRGGAGPADLLLATTGTAPVLRHLLVPRGDLLAAAYTSLLPYDAAGTPVMLAALPLRRGGGARDAAEAAAALADRPASFTLAVATPGGPWQPFGVLELARTGDEPVDPPIAFDPVRHPLPGLPLSRGWAVVREPAYRAARRRRPQAAPLAGTPGAVDGECDETHAPSRESRSSRR